MQGGNESNILLYPELSYKIIGILFEVSNNLGPGLKEKHYQKAVEISLKKNGIYFISQCPYLLQFKGEIVGRYYMDFVIENKIVLELKRGDYFSYNNINQLKNYLEATGHKLGILVNFSSKGLRYKRIINIF
jgi:GxxExxY protein